MKFTDLGFQWSFWIILTRHGLKIVMMAHPYQQQKCVDLDHRLLIALILAYFSPGGIVGECNERVASNLTCWCNLVIFQTWSDVGYNVLIIHFPQFSRSGMRYMMQISSCDKRKKYPWAWPDDNSGLKSRLYIIFSNRDRGNQYQGKQRHNYISLRRVLFLHVYISIYINIWHICAH